MFNLGGEGAHGIHSPRAVPLLLVRQVQDALGVDHAILLSCEEHCTVVFVKSQVHGRTVVRLSRLC